MILNNKLVATIYNFHQNVYSKLITVDETYKNSTIIHTIATNDKI